MAKLIIYEEIEDTIFETFELTTNRILIGRDHDNHLVLEMPEIDPTHASLELRDNHWFLQDLGGPGGTIVNGIEIEGPYMLRHNDIIELNVIKMRFEHNERGITHEFPQSGDTHPGASEEGYLSGRVWFASLAGITLVIILMIVFLLIVGHYLGLLSITDLLPPGF